MCIDQYFEQHVELVQKFNSKHDSDSIVIKVYQIGGIKDVVMVLILGGQDMLNEKNWGGKTYVFALFCPFFPVFSQLLGGQLPPLPPHNYTLDFDNNYF